MIKFRGKQVDSGEWIDEFSDLTSEQVQEICEAFAKMDGLMLYLEGK